MFEGCGNPREKKTAGYVGPSQEEERRRECAEGDNYLEAGPQII
jgi:hypothetical protein